MVAPQGTTEATPSGGGVHNGAVAAENPSSELTCPGSAIINSTAITLNIYIIYIIYICIITEHFAHT
jgi:hypothetical protein